MSNASKSDFQKNPVAIITGGLQGLGLGIASKMLDDGFDVAIIDLPETASIPSSLKSHNDIGDRWRYYQMDISEIDQHDRVLSSIQNDFGRMDCLVNNAGIAARPLTDILELDATAFDRSIDINLRGTFFLTQCFSQKLIESIESNDNGDVSNNDYKSIIVITSVLAELISTVRSPYCVTKSALSTVVKLFSARLAAAGIHVHEVRPGFMRTAMTAEVGNDSIDELISNGFVPLPRWGQPEDVGQAVSALASGTLPYMTGQPIWVAGGLNLAPVL